MIGIRTYSPEHFDEWNQFVAQSKNGTFLLDRRYMDYHQDRFADCSLMFYLKDKLIAVLPAHRDGDCVYSHRGLSYGGLILSRKISAAQVCQLFSELNAYLIADGVKHVEIKSIPYIYHRLPSEEPLYALTKVCGASIKSRDVASVVMLDNRLPLSQLRRRGVKKAVKAGVQVVEETNFAAFWQLLEANLMARYNTKPVHSLQEIMLLKSRFPQNIRLFAAYCGSEIVGGTVLYIDGAVAKTQYISASETGRHIGALDCLFSSLLDRFAAEGYRYFDFGTSNFKTSDDLHTSLIFQKEGFGGRAVCYDTYQYDL
jgi:hypothetical protein